MLHKGDDIVPIAGAKLVEHLEENLAAIDVALSPAEPARIDDAIPNPAGARYDPGGIAAVAI